jgi:hypothetical protein
MLPAGVANRLPVPWTLGSLLGIGIASCSLVPAVGEQVIGWQSSPVATMADLEELALSLPEATKEVSDDGRPAYLVHGKLFCCHRSRRRDAIDPETGERLDDVLMFRVEASG